MKLCKKCWTQYTEETLPAKCPHIAGPWAIVGGVPRSVVVCTCDDCGTEFARPEGD